MLNNNSKTLQFNFTVFSKYFHQHYEFPSSQKGPTEEEMVGWYHQLNGQKFEQPLGDSERQGSLACSGPRGCKELDTTERLNNNSSKGRVVFITIF